MTQEEKKLLFKDLCTRLPYKVIVKYTIKGIWGATNITSELNTFLIEELLQDSEDLVDIKPYLRPMSSMTEEEKKELKFLCDIGPETLTDSSWVNGEFGLSVVYKNNVSICVDAIDWLNKKMFDFRGLIPKGLSLSTEEYNPYKYKD